MCPTRSESRYPFNVDASRDVIVQSGNHISAQRLTNQQLKLRLLVLLRLMEFWVSRIRLFRNPYLIYLRSETARTPRYINELKSPSSFSVFPVRRYTKMIPSVVARNKRPSASEQMLRTLYSGNISVHSSPDLQYNFPAKEGRYRLFPTLTI